MTNRNRFRDDLRGGTDKQSLRISAQEHRCIPYQSILSHARAERWLQCIKTASNDHLCHVTGYHDYTRSYYSAASGHLSYYRADI